MSKNKLIILLLLLVSAAGSKAETPYILEKEFKNCLKKNYSEKEFLRFYNVLDSLEAITDFTDFRNYKIYTSNITFLINSNNVYQKGISYRLVSSLKDVEYNGLLQQRLPTEDNKFLKTLNAAAVMRLAPKQTTIAFDYLADHEDFASSPLIPLYLAMDPASIIKTAYLRLNDKRVKAKVFALQTLARFDPSPAVDSIIVKALKDWDVSIKGYAVVALSVHRKGQYKAILAPYYKEPALKEIILQTLEESATSEDISYAEELKRKR
jgi:hypothetical protein